LAELKDRHGVFIIEDAACALGSQYRGRYSGDLADLSVFSFHPRKFITTGEGGMVTTNNPQWASWMEAYKHFGMKQRDSRHRGEFDQIGTNFKLSSLQAAVGLVQMRHIGSLLDQRTQLAQRYLELMDGHPGITIPETTAGGTHSWQSCCIFVSQRDEIIKRMAEHGIETQIGTYALHLHRGYAENPNCVISGDLSGSRYAFENCLTLPLYHGMTTVEQDFVVESLSSIISQLS
jgi:dTDP-4-amino-4,6-dideoxygalactose transaminase